jgi:alpha,alpha-trehalose phosphorylase
MIHHERLRPPSRDYLADDWNVVENRFRPEFLTRITLAVGYG